ncbi:MAG TPA: cytochrome c oxidase subunit 3 [Steroidobacteraceae bacterium]|nr:cytochrome c oxidase subunit 3 [Steroidobacteraceae bacterium]
MRESVAHFGSVTQAREAARLGVWVFLATELMFFGPLFFGYAWGRLKLGAGFAAASGHTDIMIGTTNTAVLLTSSLFMALAVRAIEIGKRRAATRCLWITAALGASFLGLKAFEYLKEWHEQLIPWLDFRFEPPALRNGAALFYFLYFGMTGLHALHLTIGIGIVCTFARRLRSHSPAAMRAQLEGAALYWHFVDAIWVVLFPLIYLVERHG